MRSSEIAYDRAMDELFGLPAHPLLVHFPVVAVPAFTLLALAMVFLPSFRDRFGKAVAAFGLLAALGTILAAQSGEAMAERWFNRELVQTHQSLGETLRILVLGLSVAVIGMVANAKRSSSTGKDPVSLFLSAGVLLLAVLSAIWTIRTGHEGARLTWENR